MKDVKLYMTQEEYDNLRKGEYAFGYAFDSLIQAHREFKEYYGDITIMQKFKYPGDIKLYNYNGDVLIFMIHPPKPTKINVEKIYNSLTIE